MFVRQTLKRRGIVVHTFGRALRRSESLPVPPGGTGRSDVPRKKARKILTVELHRLGSPLQDAALARLCEALTATEACFRTTDLRLVYRQVGSG